MGIVIVFIMLVFVRKIFFLKEKSKRNKIFFYYYMTILIGYEFLMFTFLVDDYINIYKPYKEKQYEVVEGYISDYDTNNKIERFQIKDISFKYRSNDGRIGYHKIKNDGGYILENMQYVKVEYIEHKRLGNIIVGLWVEEKDSDNTKEE